MAPKKGGENTKKVAGNAKKAAVAAEKESAKASQREASEAKQWSKGSKDTSKADAAADKAAEAARKKAEKAALLAEEEASLPSKPKAGAKIPPAKKGGTGLDLSGLDAPNDKKTLAALNATGIDNALDALSLTKADTDKVDRHPERRFQAAYRAYEERRLEEMKSETGLRRQQKIDAIRKEFEKSPDNPFNQVHAAFDSSKAEIKEVKEGQRKGIESRLAGQ